MARMLPQNANIISLSGYRFHSGLWHKRSDIRYYEYFEQIAYYIDKMSATNLSRAYALFIMVSGIPKQKQMYYFNQLKEIPIDALSGVPMGIFRDQINYITKNELSFYNNNLHFLKMQDLISAEKVTLYRVIKEGLNNIIELLPAEIDDQISAVALWFN